MAQEKLWDILEVLNSRCREQEASIRERFRLSPAEYHGLRRLPPDETVTCQELARRMGLSLSRGSRVIDRLFSHGYVQRSDCAADRRCKPVRLTKQGENVREQIQALRGECEDRIFKDYSQARLTGLKKELKELAAAFSVEQGAAGSR